MEEKTGYVSVKRKVSCLFFYEEFEEFPIEQCLMRKRNCEKL